MQKFIRHRKLMAFVLVVCMVVPLISNQYLIVRAEEPNNIVDTTQQEGEDEVTEITTEVTTEETTDITTEEVEETVVPENIVNASEDNLQVADGNDTLTETAEAIDKADIKELNLEEQLDLGTLTRQTISYSVIDYYSGNISDLTSSGYWVKINVPENEAYTLTGVCEDYNNVFSFCLLKYNGYQACIKIIDGENYSRFVEAVPAGTYYAYATSEEAFSFKLTAQKAASINDLKDSAYEVTDSDISSESAVTLEKQEELYAYPLESYYCGYSAGNLIKITVPANTSYSMSAPNGYLYSYTESIEFMLSLGDTITVRNYSQSEKIYYIWLVMNASTYTPQFTVKQVEQLKKLTDIEEAAIEITDDRTTVDLGKIQTIYRYENNYVYNKAEEQIEGYEENGVLYKYNIPAQTSVSFSLESESGIGIAYAYDDLNGYGTNCLYSDIYNYTTSPRCIYIWVSILDTNYSYTLVKSEKKTETCDFTTPYDEAVASLYEKGELQDVYLYSWNEEAYENMKNFYGSHPEYADKVHFVNMDVSGTGDKYINTVNENLSSGESVIATFDIDSVHFNNDVNYENILSISQIGGIGQDGKTLEDYYNTNSYTCSQFDTIYNGELKLVSPYVCPGMFLYNKAVAKAVLGTDKPEEVQAYISNWDSFMDTAEAAKAKGYYMTSGSEQVLVIMGVQPDKYSSLVDNGYETGHEIYSEEWYNDINGSNVFGIFSTTYMSWNFDDEKLSDYDICAAPSNYLWGGTYYGANQACKDNPLAAQLLYLMTCDTDSMVAYGSMGHEVLVNNKTAVKILGKNNTPLRYPGDYASIWNRWDTYARQVGNESGDVDKLLSKKDSATIITDNEYIANAESVDTVKLPIAVSDDGITEYVISTGKLYSVTLPAKSMMTITDSGKDRLYVYGEDGLDTAPIVYGDGSVIFSNLGNETKTYYLWVSEDNSGITITKSIETMDSKENVTASGKTLDTTVDTTDKGASIIVSENKDTSDKVEEAVVKVSVADATDSDDAIQKGIDVIMHYNSDNEGKTQVDRIEVSYSGDESVIVSGSTINSLKNLQGNVSLEVSKKSGEDEDKTVYTWRFKPESIETVEAVNTQIDIYENAIGYENKTVVDNLTDKAATKCVLAFEHNGVLPENTEVSVGVADQYTDGTELYYYHIDIENNKLEEIGTTVVENGCVTLKLSHCSDYVMSDKPVCQHSNTEIRGQKSASCTAEGYTGDTYCKDCGIQLSTGTSIPKTAHVAGQWIIDKEATVDAEGSMHTECTVCKTVLDTKKIDKLPAPKPEPTPAPTTDATVTASGVYVASHTKDTIVVGLVATSSKTADLEYRWLVCDTSVDSNKWTEIQGWTKNNEWLTWKPGKTGDYVIVGQVRVVGNEESQSQASVGIPHHAQIKGKCQMPYTGEGGGYLIGIESYDNPNQEYTYELLVLDCTLLAEGKDAWVWTTGRCKVPETSFWAVWQPQYGYYWTLFRVYDKDGNLIDQECYPFVNAY